jgi:hypothetical protein
MIGAVRAAVRMPPIDFTTSVGATVERLRVYDYGGTRSDFQRLRAAKTVQKMVDAMRR